MSFDFKSVVHTAQALGVLVVFMVGVYSSGCAHKDEPPFFEAEVTSVYNETVRVENCNLLYWWEERGETPFLKPYSFTAKEFCVEVIVPLAQEKRRVSLQTLRIPFEDIATVQFVLDDIGKKMNIRTRDGRDITATMNFPRELKKSEKTGLADYKLFIEGYVQEAGARQKCKFDFNFVKNIAIQPMNAP